MKRVVITGLGVVSPIGNDVPTFWHNLQTGVCGISAISSFDTKDMPVKIAAEIKDFCVVANLLWLLLPKQWKIVI